MHMQFCGTTVGHISFRWTCIACIVCKFKVYEKYYLILSRITSGLKIWSIRLKYVRDCFQFIEIFSCDLFFFFHILVIFFLPLGPFLREFLPKKKKKRSGSLRIIPQINLCFLKWLLFETANKIITRAGIYKTLCPQQLAPNSKQPSCPVWPKFSKSHNYKKIRWFF